MKVNDLSKLEEVIRRVAVSGKTKGRVGVLESTNARTRETTMHEQANFGFPGHGIRERTPDEDLTNAEVGAKHEQASGMEFGSISSSIPRRSFLKLPLDERDDFRDALEALSPEQLDVTELSPMKAMDTICVTAERVVDRAFASGGFGTWKELDEGTIRKKGHSKILIETSQLRQSITHDVR